ncbi:unnamed protein product [Danaus chrysippus]|uniref:(African queen) hypothetical protein n=1 Tax=Danaus chrysippus TaxID=151541 RepID=A0A8J2R717_9NEOP|nr:unnamed protein product [Danaus chrysippus]
MTRLCEIDSRTGPRDTKGSDGVGIHKSLEDNVLEDEAGGLRTTELHIMPRVVQRGRNVTMACLYQVHQSEIYSVKWYRGTQEFYRYSPLESPTTRVTPVNGIKVDRLNSNETHVVLMRVTPNLSGNYSCEVIQNAHTFPHFTASARLDVVVLPATSPSILTSQHYYMPGDVLRGNCSSGPSRPPSELTFYINDLPVTPGMHQVQPAPDGLFWSELYVQVQLWPAHYERGAPILRCEAKVSDLYRDNSAVALYSANSDPKIERVTSPGSGAKLRACQFLLLLHIIVWANNT